MPKFYQPTSSPLDLAVLEPLPFLSPTSFLEFYRLLSDALDPKLFLVLPYSECVIEKLPEPEVS